MNTLLWVLGGVGLFWLAATVLKARGVLPGSVRVFGPLVTLHTQRGRRLLDRLAKPKRLWRMWGNFGFGVALMVMIGATIFLALIAVLTVLNPPEPTAANQPQNVLVIPGVNDFLPPAVAPEIIAGLAIGLIVHEAGHGILCRVENIDIESLGLVFLTIIPAGAFVEQDIDDQWAASRGGRGRMLAAGVTNNFAITLVAFLLLFGPVIGAISIAPGAAVGGVLDGGPAAEAGIDRGDRILEVGNTSIDSNAELDEALRASNAPAVPITVSSGDTVRVDRNLRVIGGITDGPTGLSVNDSIIAVNGTQVSTLADFYALLENRSIAAVTDGDGRTHTFAAGAYVIVSDGGPLNESGASTGPLTITKFGGTRTVRMETLTRAIDEETPGASVTLTGYRDGEKHSYNVTLGKGSDGTAFLGVFTGASGVTGMQVSDIGVQTYPAGNYLCALGGSCAEAPPIQAGFLDRVWVSLQFPVVGLTANPLFPFNFAGFAGAAANFYTAPPLVFLLANLLFWIGWVNLNLAVFNCIPTFALDGGHMLRTAVESVAARLPVQDRHTLVRVATLGIQFVMLTSLLLLLFGAQLLN